MGSGTETGGWCSGQPFSGHRGNMTWRESVKSTKHSIRYTCKETARETWEWMSVDGNERGDGRLMIEGELRWSEGDAAHYGGLEVRLEDREDWDEVGDLIADRFTLPAGAEGWRSWFGPANLGKLRITVERVP